LLPASEQQLLCLWRDDAVSTRALARLLGCSHGSLVRRLHTMCRRLTQPVVMHIAQCGKQLGPTHREIAVRVFVWGQPRRQVARTLGLSAYDLRRHVDEIRGWSAACAAVLSHARINA
jgi:DNA-directed RNA polymerase specialized sigma24 family protein